VRVLADLDQYRFEAERREDVAVGRVAGRGERDPVARLERGEKGELERRRRAGGDDDLGRIDGDPVARAIIGGDRRAQRRDARGVGISRCGRPRAPGAPR
jgi:hypothetical protein